MGRLVVENRFEVLNTMALVKTISNKIQIPLEFGWSNLKLLRGNRSVNSIPEAKGRMGLPKISTNIGSHQNKPANHQICILNDSVGFHFFSHIAFGKIPVVGWFTTQDLSISFFGVATKICPYS